MKIPIDRTFHLILAYLLSLFIFYILPLNLRFVVNAQRVVLTVQVASPPSDLNFAMLLYIVFYLGHR